MPLFYILNSGNDFLNDYHRNPSYAEKHDYRHMMRNKKSQLRLF